MKKTIIFVTTAVALLTLAACGSKKGDTSATSTQLAQAISSKEYGKAEGLNSALINAKSSDGSTKLGKKLDYAIEAKKAIANNQNKKAIKLIKSAQKIDFKNGALQSDFAKMSALAKKQQKMSAAATKAITASENQFNAKAYSAALETLQPALQPKYNNKTMHKLYTEALTLKAQILTAELGNQSTKTSSTVTETSPKSTTTSSSSSTPKNSSSTSATNDNDNAFSSSSSATDISDADISQARKDLTTAGEDQQAWSDGDIKTAITNARQDGRTHIKASDLH